jgi:hypothetical protein
VVISRPLELKIFDKEIRGKLKESYSKGQNRKIDTLQKTYTQKYAMEMAKNKELKLEKDSLQRDINRSRVQLNQEVFGDKNDQTSGISGYGTYAKQKEAILQEKETRLKIVTQEIDRLDQYLGQRKDYEGLNSTRLFSGTQLDSLANIAGFADRNWALGQLSFRQDGTRDLDTYLAQSFIGYLFILFECLPVFVKLMSPKGPYDVAVARMAEANIHFAERDKDREIVVTDEVFDHQVDTDIQKRKKLISGQSDYDLERHSYD